MYIFFSSNMNLVNPEVTIKICTIFFFQVILTWQILNRPEFTKGGKNNKKRITLENLKLKTWNNLLNFYRLVNWLFTSISFKFYSNILVPKSLVWLTPSSSHQYSNLLFLIGQLFDIAGEHDSSANHWKK